MYFLTWILIYSDWKLALILKLILQSRWFSSKHTQRKCISSFGMHIALTRAQSHEIASVIRGTKFNWFNQRMMVKRADKAFKSTNDMCGRKHLAVQQKRLVYKKSTPVGMGHQRRLKYEISNSFPIRYKREKKAIKNWSL